MEQKNNKYSQEEKNHIKQMGKLLFTPEQIAIMLQKDIRDFQEDWKENVCFVRDTYYTGYLETVSLVRAKLISLAQNGSNTALVEVQKMMEELNQNLTNL